MTHLAARLLRCTEACLLCPPNCAGYFGFIDDVWVGVHTGCRTAGKPHTHPNATTEGGLTKAQTDFTKVRVPMHVPYGTA